MRCSLRDVAIAVLGSLSAASAQADPLKVCLADRITKSLPSYGESFERGAELAATQSPLGPKSVTIERHYFDPLPLAALAVYPKLLASGCDAIVGFGYLSDLLLALKAQAAAGGTPTPIFSPFASTADGVLPKHVYQFGPPPAVLASRMVDYLSSVRPFRHPPLIVTEVNRDQMLLYRDAYVEVLARAGIRPEQVEIHENGVIPVDDIGRRIGDDRIVILLAGTISSAKIMNKHYAKDVLYVGTENFGSSTSPSLFLQLERKDHKAVFIRHLDFLASNALLERYRSDYKAAYHAEPTALSAYAYDAVMISATAVKAKQAAALPSTVYSGVSGVTTRNGGYSRSNATVILEVDSRGYRVSRVEPR